MKTIRFSQEEIVDLHGILQRELQSMRVFIALDPTKKLLKYEARVAGLLRKAYIARNREGV